MSGNAKIMRQPLRQVLLTALTLISMPVPAAAQNDFGQTEIIVTASRRSDDEFDASVPATGLRRVADFAVQRLAVRGDTRDPERRREELFGTIRAALELAGRSGGQIQLAYGSTVVQSLTLANYPGLTLGKDDRPDTNKVELLVKSPLDGRSDAKAALTRIQAFLKAVPLQGRALVEPVGDLTLSVVTPDQYRPQIIGLIADDAAKAAGRFGPGYAVEVRGIERPVEWTRASLTEVLLYLPYQLTVTPKR